MLGILLHLQQTSGSLIKDLRMCYNSFMVLSNIGLTELPSVKWVQSNIAAFGGDPARITLFGQSAGAVAVDAYNLAYHEDPVATGLIMNSGTALLGTTSSDKSHSNFTFVAESLGCKNNTAAAELDCVRGVPYQKIESFLKEYQDSGKKPAISFVPVQDDVTFFTDPAARAKQGKLTKKVSDPELEDVVLQDSDTQLARYYWECSKRRSIIGEAIYCEWPPKTDDTGNRIGFPVWCCKDNIVSSCSHVRYQKGRLIPYTDIGMQIISRLSFTTTRGIFPIYLHCHGKELITHVGIKF
jgi:hypothetical protein